ncbi:MAG: hypothetical protein KAR19_03760 [Bacteroidales bacterium]|nr:hypothetical protein [Bacteroidales bacterium]
MAPIGNIGNLKLAPDKDTAGRKLSFNVWLINTDQVDDRQLFPTPNINRELGTIPLLPGELMHRFQAIDDTLKEYTKGERGELTTEMTNSLELVMGGDGRQLYDFVEQHAGDKFIIIYQNSEETERYIAGSYRKPMILRNTVRKRDREATAITFLFKNRVISLPKIYVGSIINQAPQNVPVDSLVLNLVRGKEQYLIPENTAIRTLVSVTGITADMYGRYIELIGSSTTYPTKIVSGYEFILIDNVPWYSTHGRSIIFRILDSNTLVEVPGTRFFDSTIWESSDNIVYDTDEGGIVDDNYGDGIVHD